MKTKIHCLLFAIILLFVLSACQAAEMPVPTVVAAATSAPSLTPQPTASATPLPTRTSTPDYAATQAALEAQQTEQAATLIAQYTPTPTPLPTVTPTPLPARLVDSQGFEMALIPAGTFQMGSTSGESHEQPVHTVILSSPFYMDVYEVTNERYRAYARSMAAAGTYNLAPEEYDSWTRDSYYSDEDFGDYPVIYVNWSKASAYCKWRGGRLPTEAEWEYAARGGLEGATYPWGELYDGTQANTCDTNCPLQFRDSHFDDGYEDTAPVGSYAPNGYGLYDMGGNVWEWVEDNYQEYSSEAVTDPRLSLGGVYRVLRGGSWYNGPFHLRVASRFYLKPNEANALIGFRCVLPVADLQRPTATVTATPTPTELAVLPLPTPRPGAPTPRPAEASVIAFTMAQGNRRSVYVIAPDGSGLTQLSENLPFAYRPRWSPDGQSLAFLSGESRAGMYIDILDSLNILDYETGASRQLDFPGVTAFDWSPDSQQIAFTTAPETQGQHYMLTDPLTPVDAPYYLFGMFVADLQPAPIVELRSRMLTFAVEWLPEGDQILTLNQPAGPEAFAFLYPLLGYNQNPVPNQYVALSKVSFVEDIAIDPTGIWVALTSSWYEDVNQIAVASTDGSKKVIILGTNEPASSIDWSPDGTMLAYSNQPGWCNGCAPEYQASGVYVRFVATGVTLEIAPPEAHAYAPTFSPDSAYLVYLTATQNVDTTGYALNVYSFATGITTTIVPSGVGIDQPTWRP